MRRLVAAVAALALLMAFMPAASAMGCTGTYPVCDTSYVTQNVAGVPGTSEAGDLFGATTLYADLNDDGFKDLIIASPGEAIGPEAEAGAVHVGYGGPNPTWVAHYQNRPENPGTSEAGDRFGAAIAVGDLDNDFILDLIVGVPGEDVSGLVDAGEVQWLSSSTNTWITWQQGSSGVTGVLEAGDEFGAALVFGDYGEVDPQDPDYAQYLFVGSPGEDIGSAVDAGAIYVHETFFSQWAPAWSQGSFTATNPQGSIPTTGNAVPGTAESGDRFGEVLELGVTQDLGGIFPHSSLIVGVPHEDIGSVADAGVVLHTGWHEDEWRTVYQGGGIVPGGYETGDRFGWDLTVGDLDSDGQNELIVGVPFEDLGTVADAGLIMWRSQTGPNSFAWSYLHQGSPGVPGGAEAGDEFGYSVDAAPVGVSTGLAVGIPGEDIGAAVNTGAVAVYYSHPTVDSWHTIHQDKASIPGSGETGDRFGEHVLLRAGSDAVVQIGAPHEASGSHADAGRVTVVHLQDPL